MNRPTKRQVVSLGVMMVVAITGLEAAASEARFGGRFYGEVEGTEATVTLRQDGKQVIGEANADGYLYQLSGIKKGARVDGQLFDPQTGGKMKMSMSLSKSGLLIRLFPPGAARPLAMTFSRKRGLRRPSNRVAAAARDPALVGRWRHTSSHSDSYSGFSAVTEIHLHVRADGQYTYGNGRTMASNTGVSLDSGRGGTSTGEWKTSNGTVFVREPGDTAWTPYAKYYVERGSMMLTYANGRRELWSKY